MKSAKLVPLFVAAMLMLGGMASNAAAETGEVRMSLQYGIGYLPLAIVQHDHLIEKHLKAAGLGSTKVTWSQINVGMTMNDALIGGHLDFASGGIPPFLVLWDKTRNSVGVKGVAALCEMPNYLNTRNPNIKSIKDFTAKDRIAIGGAGSSVQTIYLEMAVAKAYGDANYKKLNDLMVGLAHPDGMAAMLSGTEVDANFVPPPYNYQELEKPGIHKVLSSYDVMGGPHSFLMIWATDKFHRENPKTYAAVFAALQEGTEFVIQHKRRAAEIYLETYKSHESIDEIRKMLDEPDITFSLAPKGIMKFVEFMNRVGTLKNTPASWKDLFFPEVHNLSGS